MSAEIEDSEDTTMRADETDSTVTLGDVEFDPVATQDFRLSVEGTSGTGKSNTLAVILEDLADVAIPTLMVERLGALSPVRLEDESESEKTVDLTPSGIEAVKRERQRRDRRREIMDEL